MSEPKQEVELYKAQAEKLQVTTPEQMTAAESILAELRRRKKVWLEAVEDTVKGAHATWKAAVAHRDSIAGPIDAAERIIKERIAGYVFEQRRKAEAERSRLQAEADAQAEAERKRAMAAAEKLKTPELKEARIEQAQAIVAPVVQVAAAVPETKLASVVTYGFEITDAAKIPAEYLMPDEKKIGAVIRATKGAMEIPGVKVVRRESVR
jgi:hypothetical protein